MLDINTGVSDAQIAASSGGDADCIDRTLKLKRQREFKVKEATAEWRITENELVVIL